MTRKKTLSSRQLRAIALLVRGGRTSKAIAEDVGVSQRTLNRWKLDPAFRAERDAVRRQVRDEAVTELAGMLSLATSNLRDILSGEAEPSHGMLRAIELALRESRASEETEIREMLRELKEIAERR